MPLDHKALLNASNSLRTKGVREWRRERLDTHFAVEVDERLQLYVFGRSYTDGLSYPNRCA